MSKRKLVIWSGTEEIESSTYRYKLKQEEPVIFSIV